MPERDVETQGSPEDRERVRSWGRKNPIALRARGPVGSPRSRDSSRTPAGSATPATGYQAIKADLQRRLLEEISDHDALEDSDEVLVARVEGFVSRVLETEQLPLNRVERDRLADELREETTGVGPLAPLLADPAVTDILVNAPDRVYVERFGILEKVGTHFRNADHILRVIERIAARVGRRIDGSSPLLDARLPDGSRVNATIPPISLDGPTISIRRFGQHRLRRRDLVRLGMLTSAMMDLLSGAVHARRSILVSGSTGAGKSTLLGVLCEAIPETERIVTIEDTAELLLDQEHWVRLESRPPNTEGQGRITARDLVINSLRMRPDRIIVGEVRGGEALDMLQALNTGHDGGLSTIHANSPRDALARLETMVLMSDLDLPSRAIREQIVSAICLVVHVRRFEDGVRRVESVAEVTGLEGETPLMDEVFRFERRGFEQDRVIGEHRPTGVVPRLVEELRLRGLAPSLEIFRPEAGS